MTWYKTGTVSVTSGSNAVIGTGTSFIANSRVGDAFRGPDGGWYEVTNIASDTALSISPNYQGPTQATGVYSLAPMQGYVKDSADALNALVNAFGATITAFNGASDAPGIRAALSAAKSGANADITSLAGLATALSITQGGTGGNTPATALSSLGLTGAYTKTNAVGTVSQTSGVPTGAIVETGTNANGTYTKWADGTMICSYTGASQVAINTAYSSSLFQSSAAQFTFPVAFVGAIPRVTPTASNSRNAVAWAVQQGDITLAASGVMAISGYNSATTLLGYIAIGRWY